MRASAAPVIWQSLPRRRPGSTSTTPDRFRSLRDRVRGKPEPSDPHACPGAGREPTPPRRACGTPSGRPRSDRPSVYRRGRESARKNMPQRVLDLRHRHARCPLHFACLLPQDGQWYQLAARMRSGHPKRRTKKCLHYNWHRHYDPTLGRYTQPDPLGFVDGPSVYGYAGNSPQVYVDPEGHSKLSDALYALKKLAEIAKKLKFEGPGKDYSLHGHGRICQVRYDEWFVRLDLDPIRPGTPQIYHLNIGSSKPGRPNWHIPINPRHWW